jgi:hypothetical protein
MEQRQLARLITLRSWVQVPLPALVVSELHVPKEKMTMSEKPETRRSSRRYL